MRTSAIVFTFGIVLLLLFNLIMGNGQGMADQSLGELDETQEDSVQMIKLPDSSLNCDETYRHLSWVRTSRVENESAAINDDLNHDQLEKAKDTGKSLKVKPVETEEVFTEQDEARAWELARSNLSDTQIQRLFEIENDGVTQEERQELKAMLHTYFSADEQAEIWDLYDKYQKSGRKL